MALFWGKKAEEQPKKDDSAGRKPSPDAQTPFTHRPTASKRPVARSSTAAISRSRPAAAKKTTGRNFGKLLVARGAITQEQLDEAVETQNKSGGLLGRILVSKGSCSEEDIRAALDAQFRTTNVSLTGVKIPPEVSGLLPKEFLLDNRVVPFDLTEGLLSVAMVNPKNQELANRLHDLTDYEIKPFHCKWPQIRNAVQTYCKEVQAPGPPVAKPPATAQAGKLPAAPQLKKPAKPASFEDFVMEAAAIPPEGAAVKEGPPPKAAEPKAAPPTAPAEEEAVPVPVDEALLAELFPKKRRPAVKPEEPTEKEAPVEEEAVPLDVSDPAVMAELFPQLEKPTPEPEAAQPEKPPAKAKRLPARKRRRRGKRAAFEVAEPEQPPAAEPEPVAEPEAPAEVEAPVEEELVPPEIEPVAEAPAEVEAPPEVEPVVEAEAPVEEELLPPEIEPVAEAPAEVEAPPEEEVAPIELPVEEELLPPEIEPIAEAPAEVEVPPEEEAAAPVMEPPAEVEAPPEEEAAPIELPVEEELVPPEIELVAEVPAEVEAPPEEEEAPPVEAVEAEVPAAPVMEPPAKVEVPVEEELLPPEVETPLEEEVAPIELPMEEELLPPEEEAAPVEAAEVEVPAAPVMEPPAEVEAPVEEELVPPEEEPVAEAPAEVEAPPEEAPAPVELPMEEELLPPEIEPVAEAAAEVEAPPEEEAAPIELPVEEELLPPEVEAPVEEEVEAPPEEEVAPIELPVEEELLPPEIEPVAEAAAEVEVPLEEEVAPVELPVEEELLPQEVEPLAEAEAPVKVEASASELIAEAERLVDEGKFDEAREAVSKALEVDSLVDGAIDCLGRMAEAEQEAEIRADEELLSERMKALAEEKFGESEELLAQQEQFDTTAQDAFIGDMDEMELAKDEISRTDMIALEGPMVAEKLPPEVEVPAVEEEPAVEEAVIEEPALEAVPVAEVEAPPEVRPAAEATSVRTLIAEAYASLDSGNPAGARAKVEQAYRIESASLAELRSLEEVNTIIREAEEAALPAQPPAEVPSPDLAAVAPVKVSQTARRTALLEAKQRALAEAKVPPEVIEVKMPPKPEAVAKPKDPTLATIELLAQEAKELLAAGDFEGARAKAQSAFELDTSSLAALEVLEEVNAAAQQVQEIVKFEVREIRLEVTPEHYFAHIAQALADSGIRAKSIEEALAYLPTAEEYVESGKPAPTRRKGRRREAAGEETPSAAAAAQPAAVQAEPISDEQFAWLTANMDIDPAGEWQEKYASRGPIRPVRLE